MTEPSLPGAPRARPSLPLTHALQERIAAPDVPAPDDPAARSEGVLGTVALPLTAALIAAGLAGLSMSTPGHRGGHLFRAWEAPHDPQRR